MSRGITIGLVILITVLVIVIIFMLVGKEKKYNTHFYRYRLSTLGTAVETVEDAYINVFALDNNATDGLSDKVVTVTVSNQTFKVVLCTDASDIKKETKNDIATITYKFDNEIYTIQLAVKDFDNVIPPLRTIQIQTVPFKYDKMAAVNYVSNGKLKSRFLI